MKIELSLLDKAELSSEVAKRLGSHESEREVYGRRVRGIFDKEDGKLLRELLVLGVMEYMRLGRG